MKQTPSERENKMEIISEQVGHPALSYVFDPDIDFDINTDTTMKFYHDLLKAIKSYENVIAFPQGTSMYGMPSFIAYERPEGGVDALRKLGFRASDPYHIIMPDGRHILHEDDDKMIALANELMVNPE